MDQYVAAVTGFDCGISWVRVPGDYNTAIFCIEAITIAFHCMLGWESRHGDVRILIDHTCCDFMCIHFITISKRTLGAGLAICKFLGPLCGFYYSFDESDPQFAFFEL